MEKRSILLLFVFLLSLILTACSSGAEDNLEGTSPEKIRIGVFEPLTGANASGGKQEQKGIELARELYPTVNLGGKEIPVELVFADNKSDKSEAVSVAKSLVNDSGVTLIIGSWGSANSIAAGPVFKESKVPAIGASCTSPLVTLDNEYYFRVCYTDAFQGAVMASYAYQNCNYNKIAVIQEASDIYSVTLSQIFANEMKELAGDENSIALTVNYNSGDRDFSAQLTAVKNSDAQAIFFPGDDTESALIMKQAREMEIDLPFLGGDTWESPELIRLAGDAAEGAIYSGFYDPAAPLTARTAEFLDAYAEKYGKEEIPEGVTALGFDAYLLAIETIEKTGSLDGSVLRDALAETKEFEGVTGYITLDENGDAIKPAVIKKIESGKSVYQSFVDPFQPVSPGTNPEK